MEYLFVYGTLLKNSGHPMAEFISKNAKLLGKATLRGKLFLVDYYPGSIVSKNKNERVKGEVYGFESVENFFHKLDEYEEFDPQNPEKSEFIRKKVDVELLKNHENLKVWTYLYNFPTQFLTPIVSGDFELFLTEKAAF
jgi:gamma-glutamylcyclotransferase (GGCT)/AIG2-like uncharacterized protein YtfP